MHKHNRAILGAAVLLGLATSAFAQGIGIGIGIDDLRQIGKAAVLVACATNFVLDESVTTGCNMVTLNF